MDFGMPVLARMTAVSGRRGHPRRESRVRRQMMKKTTLRPSGIPSAVHHGCAASETTGRGAGRGTGRGTKRGAGCGLAAAMLAALMALPLGSPQAFAQGAQLGASGLPLPRFVSLKASRVNMRVGPGRQYQVDWMYIKRGLPLEIIQEYDNWRKVRDSQGDEGWILQSLLSGARTALVAPWLRDEDGKVELKDAPQAAAAAVAIMEPGVLAHIEACENGWCRVEAGGVEGYAEQLQLWGVYPDEAID